MHVHTTYIQLEVDIHYEIDPPELGLPEQVDIQSVTVTTAHGSGRKQNLLKIHQRVRQNISGRRNTWRKQMSHISKTREEVLSLGTFDEDKGTFTFDNIVLKDALLDLYTKAFSRGLEEFRENLDRIQRERANETV
jgi:hypothetical protein